MTDQPEITVQKSFSDGKIGVKIKLKSGGWRPSIRIEASTELTTLQARVFAAALITAADLEDTKIAKKQAEKDRKRAYQDREIAAGRTRVLSIEDVFGRERT